MYKDEDDKQEDDDDDDDDDNEGDNDDASSVLKNTMDGAKTGSSKAGGLNGHSPVFSKPLIKSVSFTFSLQTLSSKAGSSHCCIEASAESLKAWLQTI